MNKQLLLILFLTIFLSFSAFFYFYKFTSIEITGAAIYNKTVTFNCNYKCIRAGYSIGTCRPKCNKEEILISGSVNCSSAKEVVLIMGVEAIETYKDGNAYIDEDSYNPNWVWMIDGLTTEADTNVADTNDSSQHSGPIIGIKNDFRAVDLDPLEEVQAVSTGGQYCFPNNYICITYESNTISDYGSYSIQHSPVDLTSWNSNWVAKDSILIKSYNTENNGIKLSSSDLSGTINGISGITKTLTDKIWVIYNTTDYVTLFYEDSDNNIQFAGDLLLDQVSDDFNIAKINYKDTGDDIQIDLRGKVEDKDLNITLDILGDKGSASIDGNDDIKINLYQDTNKDFTGIGSTPNLAEASELKWGGSELQIGIKDEDHMTYYGIIIKNPDSNGANDEVILSIPTSQVFAKIRITGTATEEDIIKTSMAATEEIAPSMIKANEISEFNNNLILIGGSVVNSITKTFIGKWKYLPGEAIIALMENGTNTILIVAGTNAEDTLKAARVLRDYSKYDLKGSVMKVTGGLDNIKLKIINGSSARLDLAKYPEPFITDGKYNMTPVYGETSKGEDIAGAWDILGGLTSATITTTETEDTTVTGETEENIAFGNSIGESEFFSDTLESNSIVGLQKDYITLNGNKKRYHTEVMFYSHGPSIETSLSSGVDDYGSNAYMELETGRLRYYYVFDDKVDLSTITADTPVDIKFLDQSISISEVEASDKFLIYIAEEAILNVGDSTIIDGKEVKVIDISSDKVVVDVNRTREIIQTGVRNTIEGIIIKNNMVLYHEDDSSCCCFDLLSFLK